MQSLEYERIIQSLLGLYESKVTLISLRVNNIVQLVPSLVYLVV